jgi:uncharacterized membrane protein YvbJ
MVYCTKCGKKNEDEAEYCSKCGAPLASAGKGQDKDWDKRCEEDCTSGRHGWAFFWGIVLILVGLWIIFEFLVKKLPNMPSWFSEFPFWGIFVALIGIMVIIWGLRVISRK